ncbi:bifunctional DAMP1 [Babesia duncani]|uniref:Bifunctional DAMP1 n=1 Tax=Babesia duncani TaxID=323732 RepID=A0AAD9PMQ8_9APIC|nr:bifunctional DAMP1 [Babesia duncani]
MGRKALKAIQKELPSIPTSYKVLIKGAAASEQAEKSAVSKPIGSATRALWRLCCFRNPARSDGLILRHWRLLEKEKNPVLGMIPGVKFEISQHLDCPNTCSLPRTEEENSIVDSYPFARVNPSVKIYRYSDDFYRYHLADLDPTWTKEETDLLFDLCEMFELRFIAIHDRFKWRKDISLEKMKLRYYTVTKRIVEFSFEEKMKNEVSKHNNPNHPVVVALEESQRHPLVKFTYNAEHDHERRQMLERSYRITAEQREMENALIQEIKQAEINYKREEKKKNDLKRLKRKFHMSDDAIPSPQMSEYQTKQVWLASSFLQFYKPQISQKHNDTVDDMLTALGVVAPSINSRASIELYCMVRGDAAIMINMMNKVESLKKELEHWQEQTAHILDIASAMPQSSVKKEEAPIPESVPTQPPSCAPLDMYNYPRPIMGAKAFAKAKQPILLTASSQQQPTPIPIKQQSPIQTPIAASPALSVDDSEAARIYELQMEQQKMQQPNLMAQGPPPPQQPMPVPTQMYQAGPYAQMQRQRMIMSQAQQPQMYGMKPVPGPSPQHGYPPQPHPHQLYLQQQQQQHHQQMMAQRMMQYQQYPPQNGYRQQQYAPIPMRVPPPNMYYSQAQMYPIYMQQHMMAPQQMAPQQMAPQQMAPQQMAPQQMAPQQMGPQQMVPQPKRQPTGSMPHNPQ